ncbi:MAG: hypothetical protein NTZ68_04540 [Candidatus Dependentiae bacterium]|nr:hypothetical protein [Candidatus Dependentiae bacterium]
MKKLLLIVSVLCLVPFNYGEHVIGYVTQLQATSGAGSVSQGSADGSSRYASCSSCCPTSTSDGTTPTAMPAITVALLDISGNPLTSSSYTFTNTNFTHNNALLTAHIFPPSNGISGGKGTYYIVYTLKSLDGSFLQKQILPTLSFSTVPGSVTVSPNGFTPVTSTFLPSKVPAAEQQQLLNIICPQSQKFLITQSSGAISSVTSLSGTFETSTDSTLVSSATGTAGSSQQITVQINSQPAIAFPASSFSSADLANGLSLTINIFPPSLPVTTTGGAYFIVATLKTLDGSKLQKQILPTASLAFTNLPSSVTISYGTVSLTSNFFSTGITSTAQTATPAFNMVSPLSLKYLLQPTTVAML